MHLVAFLPRHRFGNGDIGQFRDQPLENAAPDFRMRHLAAAEKDRGLDLVTLSQEALDVLLLEVVIVHIDFRPELDLLDLDHPLMLLGLASALLLLVLILPKIHDLADRGHCGRRNLDQVETLLPRNDQCLRGRHEAKLFAGVVDDTDFADPNPFVGAHAVVTSG